MKIIQSFAQFDEGSFYLKHDKNKVYLNFYSFLLSLLTLQKYYGKVMMYCNQKAHDSFIKYLPYDEIKIAENKNSFIFWNYYKVDAIRKQTGKFIHVDSDVFIFDDLFSEFIKGRKYDIIIQDTTKHEWNPFRTAIPTIKDFLKRNNVMNPESFDGKCFSCGTIGMTIKVKNEYVKLCDLFKNEYECGNLKVHPDIISMISEELSLYLIAQKNSLRIHEILPFDEVSVHGAAKVGNMRKYTHMWFGSKFNPQYIELMKKKINKEFPKYNDLIRDYETNVLDNANILV